jgi:opacity protein-like surface antigen
MLIIRQLPRPRPAPAPGIPLLSLALMLAIVPVAQAAELIPWLGISHPARAVDEHVEYFGGLSLRTSMAGPLQTEIGAGVRREPLANSVTRWVWPLTASLWLAPHPAIYGGGGVGWYHTTLYREDLQAAQAAQAKSAAETGQPVEPLQEIETTEKFGVHVGGGVRVPMGRHAVLDLQGRYVFMTRKEWTGESTRFGPDFWITSLGFGLRF